MLEIWGYVRKVASYRPFTSTFVICSTNTMPKRPGYQAIYKEELYLHEAILNIINIWYWYYNLNLCWRNYLVWWKGWSEEQNSQTPNLILLQLLGLAKKKTSRVCMRLSVFYSSTGYSCYPTSYCSAVLMWLNSSMSHLVIVQVVQASLASPYQNWQKIQ